MKKALLLVGFCAIGLWAWEAQAINIQNNDVVQMEDNVPTGYEIIELQGDLMYGNIPDPIVAGFNENSVYIHFNQSFGNVSISIYNGNGALVYSTVVDTSVQQTVIIPLVTMINGTYTVEVNNANGYAEGGFEHN